MKVCCQERRCGWVGDETDLLHSVNPFDGEIITACPRCKTLENSVFTACDEPGCNRASSCGTPTPTGYRNTCYDHMPVKGQE